MEQSKPDKERLWNVHEVYLQDEDKGPYGLYIDNNRSSKNIQNKT